MRFLVDSRFFLCLVSYLILSCLPATDIDRANKSLCPVSLYKQPPPSTSTYVQKQQQYEYIVHVQQSPSISFIHLRVPWDQIRGSVVEVFKTDSAKLPATHPSTHPPHRSSPSHPPFLSPCRCYPPWLSATQRGSAAFVIYDIHAYSERVGAPGRNIFPAKLVLFAFIFFFFVCLKLFKMFRRLLLACSCLLPLLCGLGVESLTTDR